MDEEWSILNNDEGVFAKEISSDGDTRGGTKCINKKLETIGSNACNKKSLVPDIGHFVKCASNRFHAFKDKKYGFWVWFF